MDTPTPPPAEQAPAEPGIVASFFAALLDHSPDSLRRLGAALALTAVPFVNAACERYLGFSAPVEEILAAQAGLAAYIGQSFAKAMKTAGAS